jgi:hypothetical protein
MPFVWYDFDFTEEPLGQFAKTTTETVKYCQVLSSTVKYCLLFMVSKTLQTVDLPPGIAPVVERSCNL